MARDRYQHGLADFIQVLDAEATLTTVRQALVRAEMGVAVDVVALYTALGGGWQSPATRSRTIAVKAEVPPTPAAADSLMPAMVRKQSL